MATYIYHTKDAGAEVNSHLQAFTTKKNLKSVTQVVEAVNAHHVDWQERTLGKVLKNAKAGDTVVVYDSLQLARSATHALDILTSLIGRGITLTFAKYQMSFEGTEQYNFSILVDLIRKIEADYITRRDVEAIERRRNMGVILGRPRGRRNKALKLDKYKKEIMRYLELSISKASIAKLVNCHPQTLYDWIERNAIPDKKPRKPRVKKQLV